jgi:hypothetical protein
MALATNGSGGIVVRGLKKKFTVMEKNEWGMTKKKVVQAVNGLDLTVADKTIFCLLGDTPPQAFPSSLHHQYMYLRLS